MTTCAVCNNAGREQADAMIRAGKQHTVVGRAFGISRYSVNNHVKAGHVAPDPSTAVPRGASALLPDGSVDPLAHLKAQLADLDAMDTRKMSPNQAMSVMDARRRTVAEIARIQPPAPPPEAPTVARLMSIFVEVMEKYPDERRRFMAEWRRYRGLPPELVVETEDVPTRLGNAVVTVTKPKQKGST